MEWRRHGHPPGFRFVPKDGELISILTEKVHGGPLAPLPPAVFHDVDVLDYHPQQLYDAYKEYMEDGFIYFFSERKFPNPDGNRERPIRATVHGAWKASGGVKSIEGNGVEIGMARTLIFYSDKFDHKTRRTKKASERTDFAIQEFMIICPETSKIIDLALYRLYMKEGNKQRRRERCVDTDASSSSQQADQPMDDGVALPGGQGQCAGVATTDAAVIHSQGQFCAPCAPPQAEMAPAGQRQPDSSCEVENEPAAMDDIVSHCYEPEMAQPCYSFPYGAPAAVDPSFLPVYQQPVDDGVYLDGVGYVSGYGGFAGAMPLQVMQPIPPSGSLLEIIPLAPSPGMEHTAAQFEQMMTPELVEQMCSAEPIPWSPDQPWAFQHCGAGADFKDGAPPAEPWAAERCRTGVGSASEDGAAPFQTSGTEHCHAGADLEISAVMGGGADDGDKNLSCTQGGFLGHGDPSCRLELEFCAQFMED